MSGRSARNWTSRKGRPMAADRTPRPPLGVEMQEPVFTETMQIGIVVRDLDAAIRRYELDYGIGRGGVHQFKPGEVKDWREHGQPAEPPTRIATAMVGRVQWELIQPLDDTSIFAHFLA